jgi:type I restriction enzyme, S subunit
MNVGCKQTEAGIIPEDWESEKFGNFISLQRGHDLTWRDRRTGEIPVMGSAGQNGFHDTAIAKGPGVVLGRSGASFGQAHYCKQDFWPHNTALYVTDFRENDPLFVFYFLKATDFSRHNSGGAQQSLNRNFIAPIPIGVPRPPEQRVIAGALSDVDELLGALDRLIAKKRDLKQAAMQQLLTGQTRLPGFHRKWEVKRMDELADIRSGGTPSTSVQQFWNGNIPWCTPTDITALAGHKYLNETNRMITPQGLRSSSAEMIPANSIVMTSRATIGECAINTVPVSTNQGFKNFAPFEAVDPEFLYYLLLTQKSGFISLCGGSTFLEISKTQLAAYSVRLPSTKAEQTAIAEVLSEMDAELVGLEQRREKTRALKQGMMQELLTGRTRLVAPTESHA